VWLSWCPYTKLAGLRVAVQSQKRMWGIGKPGGTWQGGARFVGARRKIEPRGRGGRSARFAERTCGRQAAPLFWLRVEVVPGNGQGKPRLARFVVAHCASTKAAASRRTPSWTGRGSIGELPSNMDNGKMRG
jgi:hypothetical protein